MHFKLHGQYFWISEEHLRTACSIATHAYTHACIHILTHMPACIHIYTYTLIYILAHMYTYTLTHMHTCKHILTHTQYWHMYTYSHTYAHSHIHTHWHTYTHTQPHIVVLAHTYTTSVTTTPHLASTVSRSKFLWVLALSPAPSFFTQLRAHIPWRHHKPVLNTFTLGLCR